MRLLLPLLALLPLPLAAAADLEWHVQALPVSKYAPVEFQAQLRNVSAGKIPFKALGERPALELILEPEGKPAARQPLPKEAVAYKGAAELEAGQYAWYVSGDLRHAFGRLAPGRYALRVSLGPAVSAPAAFEVIDTSVEEARKSWTAPEGIELRVKEPGVGVLVNRRKTAIGLWAYGDRKDRPLDAMATAQQWTGRAWTRFAGGFCGTGLVEITIEPGGEREVALPAEPPDGILRHSVPCFEKKGEAVESIEAVSEPFLVDNFKG
jgi:hypothetical protein